MKKFCFIVCILSLFTSSALAQDENAAFYIYQNDGHFDGFFYDQVQKITYSRVDTAGIEWDDYVSQEIVTEDSTYRIMLSAIDSVGFVQPEIKYNPKVRFMRDEGMMAYLISVDDMMLTFSTDMPESLRPKKGDVLSCPDIDGNLTAFVGKVVTCYEFDDQLIVQCAYITDPTEVYQQFISVEEVLSNREQGEVRRRIAGIKQPLRFEGNFTDYGLVNFNFDFEHDWNLSEHWNLQTVIHGGFGIKASLVYKINLTEFYLKAELKEAIEFGAKIAVDGHLEGEFGVENIPILGDIAKRFTRIPFPANMPIMYAKVNPEPFIRGEAHLNVGLNTGVALKVFRQSIEIFDHSPFINIRLLADKGERLEGTFALQAELNGMAQIGVKFQLKVGLEDWFKKVYEAEIGETVYSGPKLTGSFLLSTSNDYKNGFYEAFKDTKLNLSLYSFDNEIKAKTIPRLWNGQSHELKYTRSFSFYDIPMTLFPTIKGLTYDVKGEHKNTIAASIGEISGDVFWPQEIGIALYDKDDRVYKEKFSDGTYFLNTFNSFSTEFTDVEPGNYRVRPVIRLKGQLQLTPVYKEEQKVAIGAPMLSVIPSSIDFDEDGGSRPVGIITSYNDPVQCTTEASWIKANVDPSGSSLSVEVEQNPTFDFRKAKVYVWQALSTGETLRDTLTVNQYGEITVSKKSVNFDVAGGTEILTVKTILPNVRAYAKGDPDWLIVDLGGEALTLTALSNSSTPRSATVALTAYNEKKGGIVAVYIDVTQNGSITVSPDTLTFNEFGGYKWIDVNTTLSTLDASATVPWLTCYPDEGGFTVGCSKHGGYKARKGIITITAEGENGQKASASVVVLQDGDPIEFPYLRGPERVTVAREERENPFNVETNMDLEDLRFQCAASWAKPRISEDGSLVLWCQTNNTGRDRECQMTVTAANEAGKAEIEVTIFQPGGQPTEYDGFAVTIRWGGDARSEMMSKSGVHSVTLPVGNGAYGTGTPGYDGASIYSSGTDGYSKWHASFYTLDGLMYGSFSIDRGGEHYSFSLNGAPVGQSGPIKPNGAYRGDTYWVGDAGFSYPTGIPWDYWDKPYEDQNYVSGYTHWVKYKDDEGIEHIRYDDEPVEINVFLRIKGSGGTLPYGHPDRE